MRTSRTSRKKKYHVTRGEDSRSSENCLSFMYTILALVWLTQPWRSVPTSLAACQRAAAAVMGYVRST